MKSAPTLKRSQNGRFTPIVYIVSLCVILRSSPGGCGSGTSQPLWVSCDDDGENGGDKNEGDDEEEERRGRLGAGGAKKKTRRLWLYFIS